VAILTRSLALAILVCLLWPAYRAFVVGFSILLENQALTMRLAPMALLGIGVERLTRRSLQRFRVAEHELSHALAAIVLGRSIRRFVVTRYHGGLVEHEGSNGPLRHVNDHLIGLAPYFLPTLSLIPLLVRPFVEVSPWRIALDLVIGFTLGWHLTSNVRELRQNFHSRYFQSAVGGMVQSDLGHRGLAFSLVMIVVLWLLVHGAMLGLLTGGWAGTRMWARAFAVGLHAQWEAARALL